MASSRSDPGELRLPLSKDRVLRAAVDLADGSGIDALTMRRLGQALGVEAMSLYHHVADKDDILDGIVDLVVGEMRTAARGTDWQAAIRASAVSAHEALRRHPWASGLLASPARVRPARLRYMEAILGCLREAGFSAYMTHLAYHAIDSHVVGFALWQAGYTGLAEDLTGVAARFLQQLPSAEYPYLAEHIEQHLVDRADEVDEFEFGLDLILDGLERARRREPSA